MDYKIVVSSIAHLQVEEALKYYLNKAGSKVAQSFISDFNKTLEYLKKNPFYRFHDSNYRFIPFSKFPFIVFYILSESLNTVYINAVFHTSQSPDKYPK